MPLAEARKKLGPYADEAEMQAAFEATDKFNQEIQASGHWVFAGGLHPPSTATVVDATGDDVVTTDGPYSESKELIGGFWLWNVNSKEEAVEWASRCPLSEGDVLELRQIFDVEDFGDAIGPDEAAAMERVDRLIEQH